MKHKYHIPGIQEQIENETTLTGEEEKSLEKLEPSISRGSKNALIKLVSDESKS